MKKAKIKASKRNIDDLLANHIKTQKEREKDRHIPAAFAMLDRLAADSRDTPGFIFSDVPCAKEFILKDGSVLKNLYELAMHFEKMGDSVFSHHVTESKNDFSNWINDVMGENMLAKKITGMKKEGMQIEVLKHIVSRLR